MEKTTHTSGPWAIGTFKDIYATRTDSRLATVIGAREGNQDALANARLIAAAPDLLAAVKDALDYLNGESGIGYDPDDLRRDYQQLIDRAEGRD